jgi:hypothetical protein
MTDSTKPYSTLLSSLLRGTRRQLSTLEDKVAGLEILNSPLPRERSLGVSAQMRRDARACFVLSTGRTGTMSLTALIEASPLVEAHHEPEPRMITSSYLAWRDRWQERSFWLDALAVARDPLVLSAHKRGKLYFESNNRMTLLAPLLAELYPLSRFLLVCRKPGPFVRSAMRRGYFCGHPWDHARIRPRPGSPAADSWSDLPPEERCVWLWHETNSYALNFLESIAPERGHILAAEDLFAGDLDKINEVLRFIGLGEFLSDRKLRNLLDGRLNQQQGEHPHGREPDWDKARQVAAMEPLADLLLRLGYRE